MKMVPVLANSTIILGAISLFSLAALHILSSEFKPSFRMVSEYALGKHKWLLTLFFISWGLCSIFFGLILWNIVTSYWAKFGVLFVLVTGVGAIMGGLFDVQHKLHGLSAVIGVPFLPLGALLITYHLISKIEWRDDNLLLLLSTHSIWISFILMAVSMFLLFSTMKAAGIPIGPGQEPLTIMPKGVIALNGWANRLLVLSYILYPILTSKIILDILEK